MVFVTVSAEDRCILKLLAEVFITCHNNNNNVLMLHQLLHVWGLGVVGFLFVGGGGVCFYCTVRFMQKALDLFTALKQNWGIVRIAA